MKHFTFVAVVALAWHPAGSAGAQTFDAIKADLARPGCHLFEFLSLVESEVFDQVDTAAGVAYISSDGRYNIQIADEYYLSDLIHTYSYSESTGQVIVEKADSSAPPTGEEFSFVLKMDEFYQTHAAETGSYRLVKREGASTSYPDSLLVTIDKAASRLEQLEYYDVNEELTRIIVKTQSYHSDCDTMRFVPDFPDSAEVIKL